MAKIEFVTNCPIGREGSLDYMERTPVESGEPSRKIEIATIIVIGLASFALVSLYSQAAGTIGSWLSSTLRYIFGQFAAVPPLLLGILSIVTIRKRTTSFVRKSLAAVLFFFVLMVAWHMIKGRPIGFVWEDVRSFSSAEPGGGIIGALASYALLTAFGQDGSVVILIVAALVAVTLYLDTPLSRFVAAVAGGLVKLVTNFRSTVADWYERARTDVIDLFVALRDRWVLFRTSRTELRQRHQRQSAAAAEKSTLWAKIKSLAVWEKVSRSKGDEEERDWAIDRPQLRRKRPDMTVHERSENVAEFVAPRSVMDTDFGAESLHPPALREAAGALEFVPDDENSAEIEDVEARIEKTSSRRHHQMNDARSNPAVGSARSNANRPNALIDDGASDADDSNDNSERHRQPIFRLPPTALLERPRGNRNGRSGEGDGQAALLEKTLSSFGIDAKVVQVQHGPVITRYEVQPPPGIKVNRITSLADDIALALAATGIRIEAPVPGKSVVGIEVPNRETSTVYLREVIESEEFQKSSSPLVVALGKDIAGKPVVADLRKLLHVLIAGATGSGKSVCINTIIVSILYKALPHQVKLLMIDPKRVELSVYDGIPHLVSPVVTDPKQAAAALKWAVREMEHRYNLFSEAGVRNIDGYNRYVEAVREGAESAGSDAEGQASLPHPMPYIVVIIDELADLMMVAHQEVEESISRLAQMARAAGIHLIVATQRPSVDVITGLIKANVPSRIAFAVASSHDSRTILDMAGAERLIGKGDMLFYPAGASKPWRAQGAFISDREVHDVVEFWRSQGEPEYREEVVTQAAAVQNADEPDDELFEDAVRLVVETQNASISMLQRRFRIGYARAARLIDMMEMQGIVGPYQGSRPREVLWTSYERE